MADETKAGQVVCAHCGSSNVTMVSLFGGQLMTSQYRCESCLSYFEQIRWEEVSPDGPETGKDD